MASGFKSVPGAVRRASLGERRGAEDRRGIVQTSEEKEPHAFCMEPLSVTYSVVAATSAAIYLVAAACASDSMSAIMVSLIVKYDTPNTVYI